MLAQKRMLPSELLNECQIVILVDHIESGTRVGSRPVLWRFSPAPFPFDFKAGEFALVFFDQIDFLSVVGPPEVVIHGFTQVFLFFHAFCYHIIFPEFPDVISNL